MTDPSLSPSGVARREAILAALLRAQRARQRRRTLLKAGAGAAALVAMSALALLLPALPRHPVRNSPVRIESRVPVAESRPRIQIVRNDPSVVARWHAGEAPTTAHAIDDMELEHLLRRAGREAGFIRAGGRLLLASDIPPPSPPAESAPGRG